MRDLLHFGRGGSGTRRVFECERRLEPSLTHHIHRRLEILVRLARESDDDIGADLRVRHRLAHLAQDI